jgi:hypothetical protein
VSLRNKVFDEKLKITVDGMDERKAQIGPSSGCLLDCLVPSQYSSSNHAQGISTKEKGDAE